EIIDFKPQKDTIAVGLGVRIADWAMVMLNLPIVKLEDQAALRDEPFIFWPAVRALTTEQCLVPATTLFHIAYCDQWLGMHQDLLRCNLTSIQSWFLAS